MFSDYTVSALHYHGRLTCSQDEPYYGFLAGRTSFRSKSESLCRLVLLLHRTKSADEQQEPELLSTDMRRELQRQKWEQEQEEMLAEQPTVHYANVQYDGKSSFCRQYHLAFFVLSMCVASLVEIMSGFSTHYLQFDCKVYGLCRDNQCLYISQDILDLDEDQNISPNHPPCVEKLPTNSVNKNHYLQTQLSNCCELCCCGCTVFYLCVFGLYYCVL